MIGMLANTSRGMQIKMYYIRLESVVMEFIHLQKTKELEAVIARKDIDRRKEVHNTLLKAYPSVRLVYMAYMEDLGNGWFVLKIGNSYTSIGRLKKLKQDFGGDPMYMYMFPAKLNVDFEAFMHLQAEPYRYKVKVNGIKISRECFKVNNEILAQLVKIARTNAHKYDINKKEDLERYRLQVEELKTNVEIARVELKQEADALKNELVKKCHDRYDESRKVLMSDPRNIGFREIMACDAKLLLQV